MSVSRVPRLLRLIMLLQSGQTYSAQQLANELSISRRTLFRDLKILEEAGVPCFHDPGSGYRVARGFFLPPISLTVPETLSLMLLGKLVSSQRNRPLSTATLSAIGKLTTTVPEPIRAACQELMSHVSIDPGAVAEAVDEDSTYLTLHRCIDENRTCRIKYLSPRQQHSMDGDLDPYALHFAARAWYVLGFSHIHQEVRLFKLARIRQIEPTDRLFRRPPDFSVQAKIGLAWSLIPEGKIYDIELEFSPTVALNVVEVRWHPTQKHTMLPDGSCRMSFQVDGLGEICWWLCGYADQVNVLAPRELKERLCKMHAAALKRCRGGAGPSLHNGHENDTLQA